MSITNLLLRAAAALRDAAERLDDGTAAGASEANELDELADALEAESIYVEETDAVE